MGSAEVDSTHTVRHGDPACEPEMQTIALELAYRGTDFSGFARQTNARTIQGELEHALATLAGYPIATVCAGRTDAGVHARAQVISCTIPSELIAQKSQTIRSLNALISDDISIQSMRCAPQGFSARFDAIARQYRYRIVTGSTAPVFSRDYVWYVPHELDIDAMRVAARYLVGEHDFSAFCVTKSAEELHGKGLATCRRIDSIEFFEEHIMGEYIHAIDIEGNAFLHSMVRVIVGTLVEVGYGKRTSEWVKDVLESRDRQAAGQTAPAKGLMLQTVDYPAQK